MKSIQFTDQEGAALRQMLDLALKAHGGQLAQTYLILDGKVRSAMIEEPKAEQEIIPPKRKGNEQGRDIVQ